jgi:hypothetical protein
MKLFALSILSTQLLLAPLASAAAGDLWISLCNDCVPAGEEGAECVQAPYIHWDNGNNGLSSCSDEQQPFNDDFCSTYGTISVPEGQGVWDQDNGGRCGAAVGDLVGEIVAPGRTYQCYQTSGTSSSWCPLEYVCELTLHCW